MVGAESNNPLFSPTIKEVKQVEIKKIVEGFDANVDFGSKDIGSAADVNENGNDYNDYNVETSLHEGLSEHFENNKRKK